MEEIIEAIAKLIPYNKLGLQEKVAEPLSIITLFLLFLGLGKLLNYILKRYKTIREAIEDIKPQFDYLSVKKAKQFYISTQFQNASPARQEEPGFSHKFIARNKLIPFFIRTAFNQKKDSERFYLILADSGMGKTTFMINLYFAYNSFFNRYRKKKMKLLRFSNPDTIENIKAINKNESRDTILLLDALDEDRGIISKDKTISDEQAFKNRVDEIIELTHNFAEVLLTCRTQYFPGQEDDPYELKIKRPDEKGFYILNKIYISPFNDKEVKKYLRKKYGIIPFLNRKKKRKATKVVEKSHNLIMRPMLLSYIDYLIEGEITHNSTYSLYETLVTKWLKREAEKRKEIKEQKLFIHNLEMLSQQLSIKLYLKWKKENRLFLLKDEAVSLANQFEIKLSPEEVTGQSLLTCDGLGNWKFAHKSIMEFLLAKEIYNNPKFFKNFSFIGMDMAKRFYYELENPLYSSTDLLFLVDSKILRERKEYHSSTFYYYHSPISEYQFNKMYTIKQGLPVGGYTISQAFEFCNNYNKKFGYNDTYDAKGNFLETTGNIARSIKQVKGFRLPTLLEWELIVSSENYLNIIQSDPDTKILVKNKSDEKIFLARFAKGITIEISKFALNTSNSLTETIIIKSPLQLHGKEWCYDDYGISLIDTDKIKFTWNYTNTEDNEIKSLVIDAEKVIKTTSEIGFFRLIFIP